MPIATINPATGETLKTFESFTPLQLEEKLERAAKTFRSYRYTSFAEREALMVRAAEILESDKSRLARLMTIEMGKPIRGAGQEIEKCALVCRYYAETAKRHLAAMVETNAAKSDSFQRSACVAVMPGSPFWKVFRSPRQREGGNVGCQAASMGPSVRAIEEDLQQEDSRRSLSTLLIRLTW